MITFVQNLITMFTTVVGSIASVFSYLGTAISNLLTVPGILPGLWSVVPSSITSIYFAIIVLATFVAILMYILSK